MATVKLLTSISGPHHSWAFGDIVDVADDVARVWIKEGLALEAPPEDVSAGRIGELSTALDAVTKAHDGLVKQLTETQGKLAAATKEKQGAVAEAEVHRKAADELRAQFERAGELFEQFKAESSTTIAKAREEADQFRAQAEELAAQLAAATKA